MEWEWEPLGMDDPLVPEALAELQTIIQTSYPNATFDTFAWEDPPGMYLQATVDVADTDDVFSLVVDRLVDMQVEERLPVYVSVVRPGGRHVALLGAKQEQAEAVASR